MITKDIFNDIFDNEILPFINEISGSNLLIEVNLNNKEKIYTRYCELRGQLKEIIFGDKETDKLMDRHKVAACMCCAFLKEPIFNKDAMIKNIINTKERVCSYFYYVNELVAFMSGCKFLSFFMTSECMKKNNEEKARRIIKEFPILPPVNQSTLGCYDNILFNLSQINTKEIGLEHFDIYSYSMFFFMLENYYNMQFSDKQ